MSAWHPEWPGLSARGSLLLPLPPARFPDLTGRCEVDGNAFGRKREFHVTLLDRDSAPRAQSAPLPQLFAALDWDWRRSGERWLLREEREGELAHAIIELLDMPALNLFRAAVANASGEALAPVPAHVTLYTAGTDVGIGLASFEEFERLRLRRL